MEKILLLYCYNFYSCKFSLYIVRLTNLMDYSLEHKFSQDTGQHFLNMMLQLVVVVYY